MNKPSDKARKFWWLVEVESNGVILYYVGKHRMPVRDANEANRYHSEWFAKDVAANWVPGARATEHEFVD